MFKPNRDEDNFSVTIVVAYGLSRKNYLTDFFEKIANFAKNRKNLQFFLRNFRIFAKKVLIFAEIADFLQNFAQFLKI